MAFFNNQGLSRIAMPVGATFNKTVTLFRGMCATIGSRVVQGLYHKCLILSKADLIIE